MAEIKAFSAGELQDNEWHELQAVARARCQESMDATAAEVDAYIGWDDPERFAASHRDQNSEVGRRFNANQAYYFQRVFVATKQGEPAGWLYTAHNTSGPKGADEPHDGSWQAQAYRLGKELRMTKSHVVIREVYSPDEATTLALLERALRHVAPWRRYAAYVDRIWRENIHAPELTLLKLGTEQTEKSYEPFGPGGRTAQRVIARGSIGAARRNLRDMHRESPGPGGTDPNFWHHAGRNV